MVDEQPEDYQVGYGKPPKATQFQKGRSGNPSGRPKKRLPQMNTAKILEHFDNQEVVLAVNGKRKRMLKAEVYFKQLFTRAINGDLPAARLIADMAGKYFGPEAKGASPVHFVVKPDEYFVQQNPTQGTEAK
jgi:hypothetical protein